MVRKFQPVQGEHNYQSEDELPLDRPVAVYYRQSTTPQVGNVSTSMQKIDVVEQLKRMGWQENDIILIDADAGVSGTKRIDEREGMSELFTLITQRQIGAVACQDEDRLFRDETQIQPNIFIDECRRARVQVITPFFTYNFSHSRYGDFHARQFRFKADMAAEYIKSYVLGRLATARTRIGKEGRWTGAKIPVGFMVDMRKSLPDGSLNPNYRRFVPFEPYAQVVREHFRIFLETGGRLRETLRRIRAEHISFPNVQSPAGFKVNYQLKQREDGYYLGRSAAHLLLTNPAYAGHWHYQGVVLIWNNHEPIVPADTFIAAFNHLSKYALTGGENEDYRPLYRRERSDLDAKRNTERPLCKGLIGSYDDGRWVSASVIWDSRNELYLYTLHSSSYLGTTVKWTRRSIWLDRAVVALAKSRLMATFNDPLWQQTLESGTALVEREKSVKLTMLRSVDERMQNLVGNLETLTDIAFIQEAQKRYQALGRERERLQAEINELEHQQKQQFSLDMARQLFEQALERWDALKLDERRQVLALLIDRIEASEFSRSGNMKLTIQWRDGSSSELQLRRKPSRGSSWTLDERDRLLTLVDAGCGQLDIGQEFPDRPWYQIWNEVKKYRGKVVFSPIYYGKDTTYREYLESGAKRPIATMLPWTDEDVRRLRELVDSGASQVEIMREFPHRRWKHLRGFIKSLYGELMPIPHSGIPQKNTYLEWQSEVGQQEIDRTNDGDSRSGGRCS